MEGVGEAGRERGHMGGSVECGLSASELGDLGRQIAEAEAHLQGMRDAQAEAGGSGVGKTDDALLVVMQPRGA